MEPTSAVSVIELYYIQSAKGHLGDKSACAIYIKIKASNQASLSWWKGVKTSKDEEQIKVNH